MRSWQPGDRALVDQRASDHHGEIVTVLRTGEVVLPDGTVCVTVAAPPSAKIRAKCPRQAHAIFRPRDLRPVPDSHEATWDGVERATGWRPARTVEL